MRTFTPAKNERYCLSLAGQRRADMFYTLRFHVWNGFTYTTASENMEYRAYSHRARLRDTRIRHLIG